MKVLDRQGPVYCGEIHETGLFFENLSTKIGSHVHCIICPRKRAWRTERSPTAADSSNCRRQGSPNLRPRPRNRHLRAQV